MTGFFAGHPGLQPKGVHFGVTYPRDFFNWLWPRYFTLTGEGWQPFSEGGHFPSLPCRNSVFWVHHAGFGMARQAEPAGIGSA